MLMVVKRTPTQLKNTANKAQAAKSTIMYINGKDFVIGGGHAHTEMHSRHTLALCAVRLAAC